MRWLLLSLGILFGCSCSTAGPFVTGISSDGKGGLVIQKGYVEYNYMIGVIGNKEAGESKIQLFQK